MAASRHKIIVGIDYGTTFSGVSYVTTDKSDIDDITIILKWPGDRTTSWKSPTRIAYARENPQFKSNKWGFEVDPKLISYSWTKLLLDKNAEEGDRDDPALSRMAGPGMLKLPSFRDAAGVCEDYLSEVYTYVSKKLRQQLTDVIFESMPMECWITLPAIWSDEAKESTLIAAKRAGFGKKLEDEVYTIAEPEAAAIATLKEYSKSGCMNPIKTGENILICDCGGGTVDITTYTITQVSPLLSFDELCTGTGGKCGSTYIYRNLHALLSERFGQSFDDLSFSQKGPGSRLMTYFEGCKRDFGLNDDQDVQTIGPIRLDVPDSEYYEEDERLINLTHEDMKSLFDPVIAEITSLVGQQVKEVKEKKKAVIDVYLTPTHPSCLAELSDLIGQRIILVGGFAESSYLHNALEECQSAVVRGAALRGLEGTAPRVKYARRHYGINISGHFREGIDSEESATFDSISNVKLCKHRVKWLIFKGDEVVHDTIKSTGWGIEYFPGTKNVFYLNLYSSALTEAPDYYNSPRVDKVGAVKSEFPANFDYGSEVRSKYNPKEGRIIHRFSCTTQVVFGGKGSNLTFNNILDDKDGKITSTAVIKFDQG
ncbi:Heat shock 70 kDa protein 12A [Lachnellula suecica]|uniref:Heat shock 70 kDa protein 12A n=1 Tax=Lachnellula suecica TaxID=602035 RepID=A0A8T9C9T1_9HELO|nr:Heat shock 70 kDa protein 12A [Lachnellula suecica]